MATEVANNSIGDSFQVAYFKHTIMGSKYNITYVEEVELKRINFPSYLQLKIQERKTNVHKLSNTLGMPNQSLYKLVNKINPSIGMLILLCTHLHVNLIDYFFQVLPENLQITTRERKLQQQYDQLKQEYEALKKERDLLEKIAMRGN